ncbi:MAG TPA: RNA polymerase sigma factor [Thermoanaerobaculia bacterium]|nr:RNA polymerase sigma factor [Thermoanaerobaculia bacterium]
MLEEHGAALRRAVASYERDPALQEDLYQDVCLALWRALARFRSEASLRTFVLRIAHNRGVSHVVRQVRRGAVDEPMAPGQEAELVARQRGPEDEALGRERAERLRAALRTLPIGLRQAVTLRLEGLAHREIGEVLGISENAVAIRLSRARSRLEGALVQGGPEGRDAGRGGGEDGGTTRSTRDACGMVEEEER